MISDFTVIIEFISQEMGKWCLRFLMDNFSEIIIDIEILDSCLTRGSLCQMELVVLFLPDQNLFYYS